jgi:hypothetical protein
MLAGRRGLVVRQGLQAGQGPGWLTMLVGRQGPCRLAMLVGRKVPGRLPRPGREGAWEVEKAAGKQGRGR